jgi:hypothetical protein
MTEEEIMEAYELINQTFPFLYPYPPYEWGDTDAEEAYFEKMVTPNMWGDLPLLMNMLSRVENLCTNTELMRQHIESYLSALHRLEPEEFHIQIKPYLDDPRLRPSLFWSVALNSFPISFHWMKPWIDRLGQLSNDELDMLIEEIGCRKHREALTLLQRIRSEVPTERIVVHEKLDLYLNHPEQFSE